MRFFIVNMIRDWWFVRLERKIILDRIVKKFKHETAMKNAERHREVQELLEKYK